MNNYKQYAIDEAKCGALYVPKSDVIGLIPELAILKTMRNTVINCLKTETPIPRIKNIYPLVASINLMMISLKKLSKNNGDTSLGSKNKNIEDFSLYKMEKLSKELINKTFKWKKIKKIEILRPPKSPRSLVILNYSEKIVQNNILLILEALYDPIFDHQNTSFGFRPHKSTKDCINLITSPKNQGLQWVIKGDIKTAFNNIHPPKLAKILSELIDDKDFINLIYEACIVNTIKKTKDNKYTIKKYLEDVPQGSVISPILFNIYMHTFDIQVINILRSVKEENNPEKMIKTESCPKIYKQIPYKIERLRRNKINIENIRLLRSISTTEKLKIHNLKIKINQQVKRTYKIPRIDYSKVPFRYFFNRYADDFLILVNKDKHICEEIIYLLSEFLETLKLTLNKEKTVIIKLTSDRVYYLGYSFFFSNKVLTKFPARGGKQNLSGVDLNKVYNNLIKGKYAITKTLEPTHNSVLAKLEDQEIIEIYNSIIKGIFNYYYDIIFYKSQLNRIHYILYYSAIKTLALKYEVTSSKIFNRFGWTEYDNLNKFTRKTRIVKPYTITIKNLKGEKTNKHYALLINFHDIITISRDQVQLSKLNIYYRQSNFFEDIWTRYKINSRTTFKLTKFCNLCYSNQYLELYQIRKIFFNEDFRTIKNYKYYRTN